VLKEIKEGNKLKKLLMITPTKTENKIINKSSALRIVVKILLLAELVEAQKIETESLAEGNALKI